MPDPQCPLEHDGSVCWCCERLAAARGEEKAKFTDIWRANLPHIERRNYARGYQAAQAVAAARMS